MKRILVPTDFSAYAEDALKAAAQIAKKNNSEIFLLHMLELPHQMSDAITGGSSIPEVMLFMEKAQEMFESDIGVSLTGVAGPTSLEGEIPGTVWIGLAKKGMESFAKKFHFAYKRNKNRRLSVSAALNLIRQVIVKEPIEDIVRMNDKAHSDTSGEQLE